MFGALLAGLAAVVALALYVWWAGTQPPTLVAQAQAADGTVFALYVSHPAFGDYDPKWLVYEFPSLEVMERASISSEWRSGALFETYEEGGDHNSAETLEIVSDRFVVVSRAGILHSLYDRSCRDLLVHEESPWHAANLSDLEREKRARAYLEWKLTHLHRRIEALLQNPPKRCAAFYEDSPVKPSSS